MSTGRDPTGSAFGTPRIGLRSAVMVGIALAMALVGVGAAGATTPTHRTCEQFGVVRVVRGRYIVQQDEWNSTLAQCITVSGTNWWVRRASFDLPTDGPPAAYPSIFLGCHWVTCTAARSLPIRIADLAHVTSSWRTELVRTGAYDVAYDLWTNTTASTSGQPDGSEIMIWLNSRGGVQPAGSITGRVRLAGAWWDVWTTRMSSWNYVAYERERGVRSVTHLHIGAFLRDSVESGATSPDWYLIGAEAGFEIWRGGRGLTTDAFSFTARRRGVTWRDALPPVGRGRQR